MNDLSQPLFSEPTEDPDHPLLTWSDERLGLGVPVMDGYHHEFLAILSALATMPDGVFTTLFTELVRHTHEHFTQEEQLMHATEFSATHEHIAEHKRVLSDLESLLGQVKRGRMKMAREFVKNAMPEWFALHLVTMDSALAAHLKIELNLDQD